MGKVNLHNILFLASYITCLNLNTSSNDDKTTLHAIKIMRRQKPNLTPAPPPRIPNREKIVKESYYLPYWENGDWVFYRYASSSQPPRHILNVGTTDHRECNQICLKIYIDYGPVCGMRLTRDEWRYENKTFPNMCHLELENCKNGTKRYGWYPANKGNCSDYMTTHPTNSTAILERVTKWLKNYT